MSDTVPKSGTDAAATLPIHLEKLREALLPGWAYEDDVAAALKISRRTVQRLGLPYAHVGPHRVYHVSGASAVLMKKRSPAAA
jgi:hypothetical protein